MPFGPLNTVTAEEVREFLDSAPAEGDALELKETLPAKHDTGDQWIRGGDRIGDYARNALLKELIAFANAHGGLLDSAVGGRIGFSERAKSDRIHSSCPECLLAIERRFRSSST